MTGIMMNLATQGFPTPVIYYDPSNSISYPGSGTTINNLVPTNSLTGTLTSLTYTSPYFTFNGSTGTLSTADSSLLEPGSGSFSIEVWVYYSVLAGSTRTFVSKTDNGGLAASWSYGVRTNGTTGGTYFEVGNGTTSVISPSTTVSTGQWYHLVGVWNNISAKTIGLYVNGSSLGTNTHTFSSVKNSTNPLYFGSYNGGEYSQWLNGRMGVIRYYNTALNSLQVQQNYNQTRGIYGV